MSSDSDTRGNWHTSSTIYSLWISCSEERIIDSISMLNSNLSPTLFITHIELNNMRGDDSKEILEIVQRLGFDREETLDKARQMLNTNIKIWRMI